MKYQENKEKKNNIKESNNLMKKVDKLESQKNMSSFLYMWCTHVIEKNRTSLDLYNHFAN
jgi:hypothetical protein